MAHAWYQAWSPWWPDSGLDCWWVGDAMATVINVLYNEEHEGIFYFSKDNGTNRTANTSSIESVLNDNYFDSPRYTEDSYYKDPRYWISNIATEALTKWDNDE